HPHHVPAHSVGPARLDATPRPRVGVSSKRPTRQGHRSIASLSHQCSRSDRPRSCGKNDPPGARNWRGGIRGIIVATDDQLAALRAAVLEAFADVPPPRLPSPDLFTRETMIFGGMQRPGDDASMKWTELSNEFIETNCEELALVSAEAFHYYLPA